MLINSSSGPYWEFDTSHLTEVQVDFILDKVLDDPRIIYQWHRGTFMEIKLPKRLMGIGSCPSAQMQRESNFTVSTRLIPLTEKEFTQRQLERMAKRIDLQTYEKDMIWSWKYDLLASNNIDSWWNIKDSEDELNEFLFVCGINPPETK